MVPLKQYNTQSWISLEILKQCTSNLAPETNTIKEGKWHPSCCCHGNSYAAVPVLIKTKIPRFYLKQGSSPPNNLMGRVETIWEPCILGGEINILSYLDLKSMFLSLHAAWNEHFTLSKWNQQPCCQTLTWNQHFQLFRPEIDIFKLCAAYKNEHFTCF